MDERALTLARTLERRDDELAVSTATVAELERETGALRTQVEELLDKLRGFPDEERDAVASVERAREAVERRQSELERALHELEAARSAGGEREEAAARAAERARERLAAAENRLARSEQRLAALRREVETAGRAEDELSRRAADLGERLGAAPRLAHVGAPRSGSGLEPLIEWLSRARAALQVERGSLETERERVVREANELGASALGEAVLATSVEGVRRRLEQQSS